MPPDEAELREAQLHATWWPSGHGFPPGRDSLYVQLHSLLLGLAGRFPDQAVAELRDMTYELLLDIPDAVAATAMDLQIPLTRQEVNAIVEVSRGFLGPGREARFLDEVPLTDAVADGGHRFAPPPPSEPAFIDSAMVIMLRRLDGVRRLWRAFRQDAEGLRRVYLAEVDLGTMAWHTAWEAQRELAKLVREGAGRRDDAVPAVEVFWPGQDLPPYHQAALARAELLWSREGLA